jgi:hypothetical protein
LRQADDNRRSRIGQVATRNSSECRNVTSWSKTSRCGKIYEKGGRTLRTSVTTRTHAAEAARYMPAGNYEVAIVYFLFSIDFNIAEI